jgi:ABC-type transport system substrate-binding protein
MHTSVRLRITEQAGGDMGKFGVRGKLLVAFVAAALLATACGSSSKSGAGDAAAAVDPNGVVRIAASLPATASIVQLDPVKAVSPAALTHQLVYDTLLRAQLDGTYKPGLAKSATVVDPSTLKVELQPNLKFTDGTPLDAAAVKFNIERVAAASNPGALAVETKQVDTVTVDSPTSLTIKLKTPIAGVYYVYLSRGETMPVSPTAVKNGVDLNANPVGAGPYKLQSLKVEDKLVLVKNPDFFQADQIKVPTIEFVHAASPTAVSNALKTKVVDAVDNATASATPEIVKDLVNAGLSIRQEVTEASVFWAAICKSKPPLDNVKVRQALNYALDRDALNAVLFDGKAEPMWGFWPRSSKFHDPKLDDYYKIDLTKAKQLLSEGGYPNGFTLQLVVPNTGGVTTTATELVQQQWAKIGVKVELVTSSNVVQDFFIDNKYPGQFFPLQRTGLDKVTRNLVPGSIGDICQYNDPDLNDLVAKIRAVAQDSDAAVQLWHQLDKLALDRAMSIFGVFGTSANVWDGNKLANVQFTPNFQGAPYLDFFNVYVKK